MNIKKLVCMLCALALMVSCLAACSTNSGNTSSFKGATTQKIENDDSQVDATVVSGTDSKYFDENGKYIFDPYASIPEEIKGTTVRFATWIDHTQTEGAVPLANFEADTGLKVELFYVLQSGYCNTLMTYIATGDIPDVYVDNDLFPRTLRFCQAIDLCSDVDLEDPIWHKSMLETATYNGHVYALNAIGSPWSGSHMLYYNKTLFEDNGFKTPSEYYEEGNWTWETFEEAMKNIKSLGSDYLGATGNGMFARSMGASIIKYDWANCKFESNLTHTGHAKAAVQMNKWANDGLWKGHETVNPLFVQGKCGMAIVGVYGTKNTGYFKDMDANDIGYTYLPAATKGEKALIPSIYRMYGIINGAPNANAAGYFIRYWLDPKNYDLDNTYISKACGNFYFSLTDSEASDKNFDFLYGVAAVGGGYDAGKWYSAVNGAGDNTQTAIDSIGNEVDTACQEATKLIQTLIDRDAGKTRK